MLPRCPEKTHRVKATQVSLHSQGVRSADLKAQQHEVVRISDVTCNLQLTCNAT